MPSLNAERSSHWSRVVRPAVLAASTLLAWSMLSGQARAVAPVPKIVITNPAAGSVTNDNTPLFTGRVEGPAGEELQLLEPITVTVHEGSSLAGPDIEQRSTEWEPSPTWLVEELSLPLPDGTYTAEASPGSLFPEEPEPEPGAVTFRVDTTAPQVAIDSPTPGAATTEQPVAVSGSAGTAEGDLPAVTVQVYSGAIAEGTPVEAIEVQSHEGSWAGDLAGLGPGSYTLRAEQTDTAGNLGSSAPVPFTLAAPPPPPPPKASFQWFPATPAVGEPVSLVSTSTDPGSPISAYAWGLTGTEALHSGGPVLTTSFAKDGPHVVRLQIVDAAGRTSVATETIDVRHHALSVMQPFPIVRIAGSETAAGVRLSVLTVTAPLGARVTVRITGHGAKSTSTSRLASVGQHHGAGTELLGFPRFERPLRAGDVLEILVTKPEQIGKYTRLTPRRGKLPVRFDTCLSPTSKLMACPTQ
ncbi:MAG: hypothetical protein ACLQBB_11065 [Solirubrobacteraceae bacterium]